jgi:hypothetical protein
LERSGPGLAEVLSRYFPEGTEEEHERTEARLYPGIGSNRALLEYKSRSLLHDPAVAVCVCVCVCVCVGVNLGVLP